MKSIGCVPKNGQNIYLGQTEIIEKILFHGNLLHMFPILDFSGHVRSLLLHHQLPYLVTDGQWVGNIGRSSCPPSQPLSMFPTHQDALNTTLRTFLIRTDLPTVHADRHVVVGAIARSVSGDTRSNSYSLA